MSSSTTCRARSHAAACPAPILLDLHDELWRCRGVQVVRQGRLCPDSLASARAYLLLPSDRLAACDAARIHRAMTRRRVRVLEVDLTASPNRGESERVEIDSNGAFLHFERHAPRDRDAGAVRFTRDRALARLWSSEADPIEANLRLHRAAGLHGTHFLELDGCEVSARDFPAGQRCLNRLDAESGMASSPSARLRSASMIPFGKRIFDVMFASSALLAIAPLFPLIMFLIWLEDGRPFFFAHVRESIGGREFTCFKFRTMCRNAEEIKPRLAPRNVCDGPQFHMEHDPRLLRVGRWLRRCHLDELPQFLNVLRGEMHVVGPRPSPRDENRFCPAWREARLSVRPGITGLWQVMRTRRPGRDFQEWIRFDLAYVRRQSWRLDLWIIQRTAALLIARIIRLPQGRRSSARWCEAGATFRVALALPNACEGHASSSRIEPDTREPRPLTAPAPLQRRAAA